MGQASHALVTAPQGNAQDVARFYGRFRLGDIMSRINSDVSDVQRATADTLLSVLSNVLFLAGSVVIMPPAVRSSPTAGGCWPMPW